MPKKPLSKPLTAAKTRAAAPSGTAPKGKQARTVSSGRQKPAKASKPPGRTRKPSKRPKKAQKPPQVPDSPSELQFRGLVEPDHAFIEGLVAGMRSGKTTATVAARFLGVPEDNFAQWLSIGKRDAETGLRSIFAYLHAVVDAADAGVEIATVQRIAESRDWRGLAWLAERKWPLRYDAALVRLRLLNPTDSQSKDASGDDWKPKPFTTAQLVAQLQVFEELVVGGQLPLSGIPEPEAEFGLCSAVAAALLGDIQRGVLLPENVVRQVREHFERHPIAPPPQESSREPEGANQNEAV